MTTTMGEKAGVSAELRPPAEAPADFRRDQWDRPMIVPPLGGKPRPYTRSSSAAKTVEDHWNLEMWARRNVVYGMSRDQSLTARLLALGGDPSSWDNPTKRQVDAIHEAAAAVALAHRGADIGLSVHRLTERLDLGERVEAGPYEADLTAYTNALMAAGLTVRREWVECHLVCDELEMAGTADRILLDREGRAVVADIKTGATVAYGALGWAAQLAAYAHGKLYDVERGERLETPAIDRTRGIIIHLPAGRGVCDLYDVDLVAGYRAAQLANEIRAVRRESRRWIAPRHHEPPGMGAEAGSGLPVESASDRRERLRERFQRLDGIGRNRFVARQVPRDDLDLIEQTLNEIEPHLVDRARLEGSATVAAINERLLAVTPDQRQRLDVIAYEATRSNGSISMRYEPFGRNVALCRALVACCEGALDDDAIRTLVALAAQDEALQQPSLPLGAAIGSLTEAQAARFDELAASAVP